VGVFFSIRSNQINPIERINPKEKLPLQPKKSSSLLLLTQEDFLLKFNKLR